MSKVLFLLVCFSFVSIGTASIWDGIPIISQIKSLVQAIGGDMVGARRTQENFLKQMPVVSQVTSAVQAATGDLKGAEDTQKQFLRYTIEAPIDSTPVIGHIKGGIHLAAGDKERGEDIMKKASSGTAVVIGGMLGGPAGAVGGKLMGDQIITAVDSAVHGEFRPFGIAKIGPHTDIGENFDEVVGLIKTLDSSKAAKNYKSDSTE